MKTRYLVLIAVAAVLEMEGGVAMGQTTNSPGSSGLAGGTWNTNPPGVSGLAGSGGTTNPPGSASSTPVATYSYPLVDTNGNVLWPPRMNGDGGGWTNLDGGELKTNSVPLAALRLNGSQLMTNGQTLAILSGSSVSNHFGNPTLRFIGATEGGMAWGDIEFNPTSGLYTIPLNTDAIRIPAENIDGISTHAATVGDISTNVLNGSQIVSNSITTDKLAGNVPEYVRSNAAPNGVYYFKNYNPQPGKTLNDVCCTNGSAHIFSPSAVFTQSDVGKVAVLTTNWGTAFFGYVTNRPDYLCFSNFMYGPLITTIVSVENSTNLTLAAIAANSFTNTRFVYGADNTVAFQSVIDEAVVTNKGGIVMVDDGLYMIAGPIRNPSIQNAAILLPYDYLEPRHLIIQGTGCHNGNFTGSSPTLAYMVGTVFYCASQPQWSTNYPAFIGGNSPNHTYWSAFNLQIRDVEIRLPMNANICAINLQDGGGLFMDHSVVQGDWFGNWTDADTVFPSRSATNMIGIYGPGHSSPSTYRLDNVRVNHLYIGVVGGDDTCANNTAAFCCYQAYHLPFLSQLGGFNIDASECETAYFGDDASGNLSCALYASYAGSESCMMHVHNINFGHISQYMSADTVWTDNLAGSSNDKLSIENYGNGTTDFRNQYVTLNLLTNNLAGPTISVGGSHGDGTTVILGLKGLNSLDSDVVMNMVGSTNQKCTSVQFGYVKPPNFSNMTLSWLCGMGNNYGGIGNHDFAIVDETVWRTPFDIQPGGAGNALLITPTVVLSSVGFSVTNAVGVMPFTNHPGISTNFSTASSVSWFITNGLIGGVSY